MDWQQRFLERIDINHRVPTGFQIPPCVLCNVAGLTFGGLGLLVAWRLAVGWDVEVGLLRVAGCWMVCAGGWGVIREWDS